MSVSPDKTTAVILAGGFGTRIKHLLGDLPKPMAPVNSKPFVEWIVRYLAAQRISRFILSTGYMAETVERHFLSQPVESVRVRCVPETSPLGTAGGFLNAIHGEKAESFLVLNGDSLVLASLENLFKSLNNPKISGAILGLHISDASRFGTISQNGEGDLSGFNEKKPGAGIINAGIYLFRADAIAKFPKKTPLSFETEVFPSLIAQKVRVKVCVTDAPFLDIGTPESLPLADDFVRRNAKFFKS
ncbi:MAG TPA: sugar phosphate nucleotidyltransferase [Verrucomicrobiae bacterium]|nr:sugar phosphate nucleotidyltransferase [Verrucomicrobiae bacterium]